MENVINEQKIMEKFPELRYDKDNEEIIGTLCIDVICKDEYIKDNFEVKICNLKNLVPFVFETSRKIDRRYHHLYSDYRLCLATDLEQEIYLKTHTIEEWIEEYVVKYFISYIFYQRYNVFPFDEHSHGSEGVYEYLQKYLRVDDINVAKGIFEYVCTQKYRGHRECPCGSGQRIRNCHGKIIIDTINSNVIEILKDSYRRINDVGRNKPKAK